MHIIMSGCVHVSHFCYQKKKTHNEVRLVVASTLIRWVVDTQPSHLPSISCAPICSHGTA